MIGLTQNTNLNWWRAYLVLRWGGASIITPLTVFNGQRFGNSAIKDVVPMKTTSSLIEEKQRSEDAGKLHPRRV